MTVKTVFFFCRETDTITKDTRTVHGQKLTWLIATNAIDERMVKKTETNKQAQNRLYEQAQVRAKHFKINANQQVFHSEASCWSLLKSY